ncbi:MAG: ABC transporter ATP-binding protein [Gemmatimonadetes bacterium]|nr:ABC transporter ATP-binding protein [Gemmatimonadota bacterium]MBK7784224.1 ABC transporter ATP-binding protein [Gemmatimonadota bacterium]MBK9067730.1 ABC transporter ATP-binding protein [Gemmatimonadota bacterium]
MTAALRLAGLHKAYKDVRAVDGLDLEVRPGECFGLLGPNGAGKTTTIEICEGLLEPDHGTVEILGLGWRRDRAALRERIGVSLQETQFSDKLTTLETVALFRSFYAAGAPPAEVLARVQLTEKAGARVGQLSGGQKQRLAIACALVGAPELLFLDEPTTGLDPQSRRQLWELIAGFRAQGRTVILTTHYMDEAERLCDRVAVVDRGKVIALGTPRELIASIGAEQVIEVMLLEGAGGPAPAWDQVPGVLGVQQVGRTVTLRVHQLHTALPGLLALLTAAGVALEELRTHAPTLEDVFVALTGRHLRDG